MARSVFSRFDRIKKRAGKGCPYAVDCYAQYINTFSKQERDLISHFRKYFEENLNNISVIDSYSEEQISVIDRFLGYVSQLPDNGRAYKKRIEEDRKAQKNRRKDFTTEENFLNDRYHRSQRYFSDAASKFKKNYYLIQRSVMALSLAVSILSLLFIFLGDFIDWKDNITPKWFNSLDNMIVAAITAMAAWLSSNDKLYRNMDFWVKYRLISEALKRELQQYQGRYGVYDIEDDAPDQYGHTKAEKLFRSNVEDIIQSANDSFVNILQSDANSPLSNVADKYANSFSKAGSKKVDDTLGNKNNGDQDKDGGKS